LLGNEKGNTNSYAIFDCGEKTFDYGYVPANPNQNIKITLYSTILATEFLKKLCTLKKSEDSEESANFD